MFNGMQKKPVSTLIEPKHQFYLADKRNKLLKRFYHTHTHIILMKFLYCTYIFMEGVCLKDWSLSSLREYGTRVRLPWIQLLLPQGITSSKISPLGLFFWMIILNII